MTSDRKIQANRTNARASTGAKTAHGRARSARNALRHGLSLSVESDPLLAEEIEALARQIAGPGADAQTRELARRVAEAQIELLRVRHTRHQMFLHALGDPNYQSRASMREKHKVLMRLLGRNPPDVPLAILKRYLAISPKGPHRLATILSEEAHRLAALDRYERRALSRRKFAIREFDVWAGK